MKEIYQGKSVLESCLRFAFFKLNAAFFIKPRDWSGQAKDTSNIIQLPSNIKIQIQLKSLTENHNSLLVGLCSSKAIPHSAWAHL